MGREHTRSDGAAGRAGMRSPRRITCGMVAAHALPTVVMIPGTLCDARLFARQKRALRGLADVRVVDYEDLRPNRNWADALLARLPERFSVVGFSLGGLWALELVRRAPHRVERLAMVASNAYGASAAGRRNSARSRKVWRARGPEAVVRRVSSNYFHQELQRRRHAALVTSMVRRSRRAAAAAQFHWAASRPDGHAALSAFQGPVLLVSGARDRVCTPAMQRAMVRAQPRAQWLELPRVGHFVPLEGGARLCHALRRWLNPA